jgi:DNA-binding NarL/FixJ family response regulator
VGEASDGVEAVGMAKALFPHVVLMDIRMPKMDGIEATLTITRNCPEAKVLVLTQYDHEEYVRRVMKSGARGYILKDSLVQELAEAIRRVHEGGLFFTPCVRNVILESARKHGDDVDL